MKTRQQLFYTILRDAGKIPDVFEDLMFPEIRVDRKEDTIVLSYCTEGHGKGIVLVYLLEDGEWVRQESLTPHRRVNDSYFGTDIALSDDGNTLAVSSVNTTSLNFNDNGIDIYHRHPISKSFKHYARIIRTSKGSTKFGTSLSLSSDGSLLLIGCPVDNKLTNCKLRSNEGTAYLYEIKGHEGVFKKQFKPKHTAHPNLGSYVDLSEGMVVIGTSEKDTRPVMYHIVNKNWVESKPEHLE